MISSIKPWLLLCSAVCLESLNIKQIYITQEFQFPICLKLPFTCIVKSQQYTSNRYTVLRNIVCACLITYLHAMGLVRKPVPTFVLATSIFWQSYLIKEILRNVANISVEDLNIWVSILLITDKNPKSASLEKQRTLHTNLPCSIYHQFCSSH